MMERLKRGAPLASNEYTGPEFSSAEAQAQKRSRQVQPISNYAVQGCGPAQLPYSLRRVQSAPVSPQTLAQQQTWDDLEHWRGREATVRPCPARMTSVQPEVTAAMREKLVDWLGEVRDEFRLHTETLFLAVSFLDRYLCAEPIPRVRFQLLGMCCMWVAAKYEEVYPPPLDAMLAMAENMYGSKDMLEMERQLLYALDFQLAVPTALRQLHYLLQLAPLPEDAAAALATRRLAEAVLELSLLEPRFSAAAPTHVASAAVYLALGLGRQLEGLHGVVLLSAADPNDLGALVKDLFSVLTRCQEADRCPGPRTALMSRYHAWEELHVRPRQQQHAALQHAVAAAAVAAHQLRVQSPVRHGHLSPGNIMMCC